MGKAMAPHSSTLAWKIPGTEKAGRLQSMGSRRVRHDWVTSLSLHFHALEKEMATHSSILAWRIPDVEEPGGLLSMGSHRVVHNWSDLAAAAWLYCEMTWHKLDHMISLLKWWQMRYSERASHWNTRKKFFNALGFTIKETDKAILDTI